MRIRFCTKYYYEYYWYNIETGKFHASYHQTVTTKINVGLEKSIFLGIS